MISTIPPKISISFPNFLPRKQPPYTPIKDDKVIIPVETAGINIFFPRAAKAIPIAIASILVAMERIIRFFSLSDLFFYNSHLLIQLSYLFLYIQEEQRLSSGQNSVYND